MKAITLSKKSWHYKLHVWVNDGIEPSFWSICPYFWTTLFMCLIYPIIWIDKLIIDTPKNRFLGVLRKIFIVIGYTILVLCALAIIISVIFCFATATLSYKDMMFGLLLLGIMILSIAAVLGIIACSIWLK